MSPSPLDQSRYQVRFDWALSGLRRLAPADVVVLVDVLASTDVLASADVLASTDALGEATEAAAPDARLMRAAGSATVLSGSFANAAAVAGAVRDIQTWRGERTAVAVIAAGEPAAESGETRFAVEDLLGAGAIIDALTNVGIDHSSPEAAAACEAFRALRPALRHLITASGSGQELTARGGDARPATELNTSEVVPVLSPE